MKQADFYELLVRAAGRPITLRLNDNLHNMVSASNGPKRGEIRASVHRMFLRAPEEVIEALGRFIVRPTKESRRIVREYISRNHHRIDDTPVPRRTAPPMPRGVFYDLAPIAARLNRTYFDGKLKFAITWGRRPTKQPRSLRQITLGNWNVRQCLIRIHPILDSPTVPPFYLDYIIFHEMAHIAVPSRVDKQGRLLHHTPEFYAVERRFRRYREAIDWQNHNLDRLLSAWCRRRQLPKEPRTGQLRLF
ncbi:hypothetical protein KQI84_16355 [bacterium]|nr:hypothetical protein [bacterium]